MSNTDLAWAAGFFDGEGSINAYRHKQGIKLQVALINSNLKIIQRFKKIVNSPGGIYLKTPSVHSTKPCWIFLVSHKQAEEVLTILLPFLKLKNKQAKLALKTRKLKQNKPFVKLSNTINKELDKILGDIKYLNKGVRK